jgi:hypothetical protein
MALEFSTAEFWTRFALASLAAWRITHLLAHEDGPGDVIHRLRTLAGRGFWGRLMDCSYCLSLWIAAPLSPFVARARVADILLVWVAISGAACLLERATVPSLQIERPQPYNEPASSFESVFQED